MQPGLSVDEHIAVLSTYLGHVSPADTYWYLSASPELMALAGERLERALRSAAMSALAPALQAFFTDRLIGPARRQPEHDRRLQDHLPALAAFAASAPARRRAASTSPDLDAPLIAAFLDHLERDRHNSAATRNNRLAAIHSLFAYLALHHPEHAAIDPARARHPAEADRAQHRHLPDRP